MGINVDDNEYIKYLSIILNNGIGSKYLLFLLYLLMPMIAFLIDGLESWFSSGTINYFLFTETFIFCEIIVTITIVLRFLRDCILHKRILPDRSNTPKVKKAIMYIRKRQEKNASKDSNYIMALESVLTRNYDILDQEMQGIQITEDT